jgi:3-(methylsulfanyl)propanoyl-CoA dehydrogenase
MRYQAPLDDYRLLIHDVLDCNSVTDAEIADSVLQEAARFFENAVAPTCRKVDREGATVNQHGDVHVCPDLAEAYRLYAEAGWGALRFPAKWGGLGLPRVLAAASTEMLNAASLTFGSGTLLCDGAIEALLLAGSEEQKALYLPPLMSGAWTACMNLTEGQAGSDLGAIRTIATRQPDEQTYHIKGSKIFTTFGDHDMAENIVHMVLARTSHAPPGIRGLSLFIVPKFIPRPDGGFGRRNGVKAVSIEHKLGIRGSPTCAMNFGGDEPALGWLVGEENRGLDYMFVMMNAARYTVGLQSIGIADRALQLAEQYAAERIQGRPIGSPQGPIEDHPDVRRTLFVMRAQVEAARALAFRIGAWFDVAERHPDSRLGERLRRWTEFLVPIHKGHHSEMAVEVASLGIQVHGGLGYTEDPGAAQLFRDARILPIYEGTTAIQANDLLDRKTLRDKGRTALELAREARTTVSALKDSFHPDLVGLAESLSLVIGSFEQTVTLICQRGPSAVRASHANAVPFLRMAGMTFGAWQICAVALAAQHKLSTSGKRAFLGRKLRLARFYLDWFGPLVEATARSIEISDERYLESDCRSVVSIESVYK